MQTNKLNLLNVHNNNFVHILILYCTAKQNKQVLYIYNLHTLRTLWPLKRFTEKSIASENNTQNGN